MRKAVLRRKQAIGLDCQQSSQSIQTFVGEDCKQKITNCIKNNLLFSLDQSLQKLMHCIMNNKIKQQLLDSICKKKQKDLILDSKISEISFQKDKEEYSSLIYFHIKNELKKFPSTICQYLCKKINKFYLQMLRQQKLNVIKFYKFIRNKIDEQIKSIMQINQKQNQNYKEENCSTQKNYNIGNEGYLFTDNGIKEINYNIRLLYGGVMDVRGFCVRDQGDCATNGYFYAIQYQYQRNQDIMRNIVKFSTKMKKILRAQKFRSVSGNEQIYKRTMGNFRIKKSLSVQKNRQADVGVAEITRKNKQNIINRIYLKPLPRQKLKLKLRN